MADYTLTSRGMVLRMVLRAPGALEPPAPVAGVRLTGPQPERMTAGARSACWTRCADGLAWSTSRPGRRGRRVAGRHQGLIEAGTLEIVMMPAAAAAAARPIPTTPRRRCPTSRRRRPRRCARRSAAGGYSVTLLDGVTGSGKTEVYFEAVAAALKAGRQVLILLPEIALTADFLAALRRALRRAAGRMAFGRAAARARAGLARRRRRTVRVVVGARSALFLPFRELGLIVVDEEHDLAYKQEERVVLLTPATWRWCARTSRRLPGGAVLGDAVDRDRGSTPTPAATGGSR